MKIALDAMGSDAAPTSEVEGSIAALEREGDLEIVLIGDKKALGPFRKDIEKAKRISIVESRQVIGMHESPSEVLRTKTDSSIAEGMVLLKQSKADAFVSAGNTGAVAAFSIFTLGRIKGIERPALGAIFPTPKGQVLTLDVGANVDPKPIHLVRYAVMGRIMVERVYHVNEPRVGLLNVGHEEGKGDKLSQEAFNLLSSAPIKFVGNIEGSDVFRDVADVIVTDGFTGNIMLKFGEGMGAAVLNILKETAKRYRWRSWFSKKVFKDFIEGLNYEKAGGAILLGVDKPVIVSHGRSTPRAIKNALRLASFAVREGVVDAIKNELGN
ncbi:phosphate acyltransferase PlsX [bacterium]|nr:phosphate acyltransferase PlsX [bacterium]